MRDRWTKCFSAYVMYACLSDARLQRGADTDVSPLEERNRHVQDMRGIVTKIQKNIYIIYHRLTKICRF
jgi:hypothetical protein